ncbi:glycosyltransferase [Prauserella cavernicola]|uniref:Erythromycin biosynthesis protein CIII-like C-terminal domain-containing protein n=1 Tax=Prauserella cavernicola TaxID=2800127 RepID=A0A934QLY4_9PSEU|nr:nucleotide disphospho-sugar-binding domain-containing protein [Prauserella cavernicola]MBK1783862.1 hypothetical protein [Prauserella cavernicola]
MRVLFSALPLHGHLLPLLPLARAAHAAGASVTVATHEGFAPVVGDLPFTPCGPSFEEIGIEYARRHDGATPRDLAEVGAIVDMFVDTRIDLTYERALAVARQHRPDVVVGDTVDFVAPLVAAALGVPWVPFSVTTALPPDLEDAFTGALRRRLRRLDLPPITRTALVDVWPSWLQAAGFVAPADSLAIRPKAHHGDAEFAPSFPGREQLPTVVLSLGTVVTDQSLLKAALHDVLRLDVNVVVTTGAGADPTTLDAPADRVHATGFVPMDRLLRDAAVLVGASGAGTTLGALSRGVPMVLMPMVAEQHVIAEQVTSFGAATLCAVPDEVAANVSLVLEDETFRDSALTAADRLEELDDPDAVWSRLLDLLPS